MCVCVSEFQHFQWYASWKPSSQITGREFFKTTIFRSPHVRQWQPCFCYYRTKTATWRNVIRQKPISGRSWGNGVGTWIEFDFSPVQKPFFFADPSTGAITIGPAGPDGMSVPRIARRAHGLRQHAVLLNGGDN